MADNVAFMTLSSKTLFPKRSATVFMVITPFKQKSKGPLMFSIKDAFAFIFTFLFCNNSLSNNQCPDLFFSFFLAVLFNRTQSKRQRQLLEQFLKRRLCLYKSHSTPEKKFCQPIFAIFFSSLPLARKFANVIFRRCFR